MEEVEDQIPPERHAEEGEDNVQLNPECQGYHMHASEGEHQVQLNPEHHDS